MVVGAGMRRDEEKNREVYVRSDTNFSSLSGSSVQQRIPRKPVAEPVSPITASEHGGEMVDLSSVGGYWGGEMGGNERYEAGGNQMYEAGDHRR